MRLVKAFERMASKLRRIDRCTARRLGSNAARYREQARPSFLLRRQNWARVFSEKRQETGPVGRPKLTEEEIEIRMRRLEAVFFLAREPLNTRKLSQHADLLDGTEARTLIRRLNQHFDQVGRAFRVEQVAGGFQLMTRRQFAGWLRRLGHVPNEIKLSNPALETLAVVAYRQPVMRVEIEAIRGVACGEILRQLLDRDLVRISGRSEELGRPFLYSTSKRFLMLFGLNSLEGLPRAEVFQKDGFSNTSEFDTKSDNDSDEIPMQLEEDEKLSVGEITPAMIDEETVAEEGDDLISSQTTAEPQDIEDEDSPAYDDDELGDDDDELIDDDFDDQEWEEVEDDDPEDDSDDDSEEDWEDEWESDDDE